MLLLTPGAAHAIQLRWSTGVTDLTFSSATRCTLVVQADSAEVRLPSEWRLLWVADSAAAQFVAVDPAEACLLEEAQVSEVEGSATAADSAANLITANFCSGGSEPASTALYVLDVPGGAKGAFKVIALDPADLDSSRVVQSPTVTFNGGVEAPFPSVILHSSTVHRSTEFQSGSSSIAATRPVWFHKPRRHTPNRSNAPLPSRGRLFLSKQTAPPDRAQGEPASRRRASWALQPSTGYLRMTTRRSPARIPFTSSL